MEKIKKTKCKKCKRGYMRQQVSVFVDIPLMCRNLSKKGIRNSEVKISGVGWPNAVFYCDKGCGNFLKLSPTAMDELIAKWQKEADEAGKLYAEIERKALYAGKHASDLWRDYSTKQNTIRKCIKELQVILQGQK